MKKITHIQYVAEDGVVCSTEQECIEYEEVLLQINKIMKDLIPVPKHEGCEFENGGGYIQQEQSIVDKAKTELVEFGNKFFKLGNKMHFNIIGRLFCDSQYPCFYSAWIKLANIDKYYREWGQQYYALNPMEGVQKPFIFN